MKDYRINEGHEELEIEIPMSGVSSPGMKDPWWKTVRIGLITAAVILVGIPLFCLIIYGYHRLLLWYIPKLLTIKETGELDVGIIGDSLVVLSFVVLIISLVLSTAAMKRQSQELQLSRSIMGRRREEEVKANRQRATFEVMENIRMLGDNINRTSEQEESWEFASKNEIVRSNLSRLIEYALEILVDITRGRSTLLREFAQEVINENKGNLSGLNLSQLNLRQANLEEANLEEANLEESILLKAKLTGANLRQACLREADLSEADLGRANIEGADFRKAVLRRARLQGANLTAANFWQADLDAVSLEAASLESANFWRANLAGADLRKTLLKKANLWSANLHNAKLNEANLVAADLRIANLGDANLTKANLAETNLIGADLSRARLSDANLQGCNLWVANFKGADLSRVNLKEADLRKAKLEEADLREADLQGGRLEGVRLEGANLKGANLSGVKDLFIENLAKVRTLYKATLDPDLREQVENEYPHLLERPEELAQ